ncbi:MAG: aminoglycoside phosphotransferase family protein [Bacillota bacterium]
MISKTKVDLDAAKIAALCASAGLTKIEDVHPLSTGEFNAVYAFDSGKKSYALKVAPAQGVPVMTYEKNMMRSEIFWYGQLREHTDVPAAEIVHMDFTRSLLPSDFFIMRRIPGRQMSTTEFTPKERALASVLLSQIVAKMHRIPHEGFGYPQCGIFDTWPQALYAMIAAMVSDAAMMGQTCENGEKTLAFISKHAAVLERAVCRMVNFDLWESNVICERTGDGLRFVMIDPERGYWGDPIMDFICFETDKPLKRKLASLKAYNQTAEHPVTVGREEEIRFALAQAFLGVIMEVERYYRYVPGDEGWARNDRVCKTLFDGAFACLAQA